MAIVFSWQGVIFTMNFQLDSQASSGDLLWSYFGGVLLMIGWTWGNNFLFPFVVLNTVKLRL